MHSLRFKLNLNKRLKSIRSARGHWPAWRCTTPCSRAASGPSRTTVREARSSADAVGLWQFTPETGRQYGLRVEDEADDRTDRRLSTSAAGRYLRNLFDDFGSWELAAAAYNAGPTRVREALDSSGAEDYWGLVAGKHLPPETRAYVPKFLAVVQLASERAGSSELELAATNPGRSVTAPIGLDLQ